MNSDFSLAVHSLLLLAHHSEQMITSDVIAASACVHPVRARKILSLLCKNHYICSKEGAGGGFFLAKHATDIWLDELYQLISTGSLKPKCPKRNDDCLIGSNIEHVLEGIFSEAEKQVVKFLNGYNIADVLKLIKQEQN
ncbi:transcriptional regulator, BadM/Rrf2 family [Seinonella peptonophila]|uniref:Transcriptional regulator, BadM/Rrf2 family n=1 Tax=Seinonella peptonophila TaxID=112248 RepID=A0A1M4WCN6_9BACL|nr:Rrf2 family transcriptional regulator [Seinonella peptonophila]SHE78732.1 transcriptional regulator, BadM/Rrf2 family [Seinonella peptonophila]